MSPPAAVRLTFPQPVVEPVIDAVGLALTVIVITEVEEQEFRSVPVTVYDVVDAGIKVLEALVEPSLHE